MSLVWDILITTVAETTFQLLGRNASSPLRRRDAYFVVTISWALFTVSGTLPFMVDGYAGGFTDAFLEAMSGFTITGVTAIDCPEHLSRGILFQHPLTQWIGGSGAVSFTITILPSMAGGSVKVFATEATGPIKSKLHPRLSTSAKWVRAIYLTLAISYILSYKVCGMGWFDASNYPTTSTIAGRFSTGNDSIATFHSPAEEYVCALFRSLPGVDLTLLHALVIGLDIKKLLKNSEFHSYTIMILSFTIFISFELIYRNHYKIEHAFRSAFFQVVSLVATIGPFSDNVAEWPHATWVVLVTHMFFDGCSGPTSDGTKNTHGVVLLEVVRNEFRRILRPNAVLPMKVDGVNILQLKHVALLGFTRLHLILTLFCAFTMIAVDIGDTDAIMITLSSLGNVGPTLGMEIGPIMLWTRLPDSARWICPFLMLVSRLELFTVPVLFSPAFRKEN